MMKELWKNWQPPKVPCMHSELCLFGLFSVFNMYYKYQTVKCVQMYMPFAFG